MGECGTRWRNPTRRQILRLLREGDLNAGEIADKFDMTKPSISHHLNALKGAGLVRAERSGQNIVYSINTSVLEDLMDLIADMTGRGKRS
jgi:DNA-binding transcriptional ArsR family regulator